MASPWGRLPVANPARVGAAAMVATVAASSLLAYGLGHAGLSVAEPAGLAGCRGHVVEDISCSGVFVPEYFVFGAGVTVACFFLAVAFVRSAVLMAPALGRVGTALFMASGVAGCVLGVPMAWVSMGMDKQLHLGLARAMLLSWLFASVLRAASGLPPRPRLAACTVLATAVFVGIWTAGHMQRIWRSWAEWVAVAALLVNVAVLPQPNVATERELMMGGSSLQLVAMQLAAPGSEESED